MYLRIAAILLSLLVHGTIGYAMLPHLQDTDIQAMDVGKGMDVMLVQGANADVGVTKGEAEAVHEQAEITPMVAAPPPPPEEKKPDELRDVIASAESPVEQTVIKEDEPPPPPNTPPPPPETARMINQPAQVAVVEAVQSAGQASGGDAKAFGRYMNEINERVQKAKRTPGVAASGTVVLRYTIGLDGQLLSKEIASSSGSKSLDEAAAAALDRAAPFPPIPPEVSIKPLAFTQPFKFIMR
ncbi:MAG: energy transducer TonB [Hyphomicrobium sp.]|uniref:energy transducer TonB family protein n=1 Tax=Hyphomicrobium sp. TaxID=82 RepID=UPI0039E2CC86